VSSSIEEMTSTIKQNADNSETTEGIARKAAGEILSLSRTSVDVAEEAGKRIVQVVPDINKTADLVAEISAASREQSVGVDQIARVITQLDSVIQQNASASEEMASMAEELSSQAEQLASAIPFFTIDDTGSRGPRKAIAPVSGKVANRNIAAPHAVKVAHTTPKTAAAAPVAGSGKGSSKTAITLRAGQVRDQLSDDDFEEFQVEDRNENQYLTFGIDGEIYAIYVGKVLSMCVAQVSP